MKKFRNYIDPAHVCRRTGYCYDCLPIHPSSISAQPTETPTDIPLPNKYADTHKYT